MCVCNFFVVRLEKKKGKRNPKPISPSSKSYYHKSDTENSNLWLNICIIYVHMYGKTAEEVI